MDISFNAKTYKSLFDATVAEYFSEASTEAAERSASELVAAMSQAIDVMERADSDFAAKGASDAVLDENDVNQIGEHTLTLIEGMVGHVQSETGQQRREIMRLTVPVALWIAKHGGRIDKLDIVNSLAGYANDLTESTHLAELCLVIRNILAAVSDVIRQDLESTNQMRPWRILNLNYAIVATRSHDPALIEEAYSALIKNLPQEARQFFREGMQQMDVVGYPQHVREVVEKFDREWGSDSTLH